MLILDFKFNFELTGLRLLVPGPCQWGHWHWQRRASDPPSCAAKRLMWLCLLDLELTSSS
jgi:hypothetical protein